MVLITKNRFPEVLALIGLTLLIVATALFSGRVVSRLDIATLMLPVAILCMLPLLRKKGFGDLPFVPVGLFAMLFLIWVLVSMLVVVTEPMVILTWGRYACYFLFIPLVGIVASDQRARTYLYALLTIVSIGICIHALYQYFDPSLPGAEFGYEGVPQRIFSTFIEPNTLAKVMVVSVSATLALFGALKTKWRYGLFAVVLLEIIVLFLTYSRSSLLALFVGIIFGLCMINWKAIIPASAVIVAAAALVPGVFSRIKNSFTVDSSNEGRLAMWRGALKSAKESPVFGKGMLRVVRESASKNEEIYQGYFRNDSHNSYLQILVESGVFGMVFFAGTIASIIWGAIYLARKFKGSGARAIQNAALAGGIVAYSVNALAESAFQHPRPMVYFLVLVGALMGLGAGVWPRRFSAFEGSKIMKFLIPAYKKSASQAE